MLHKLRDRVLRCTAPASLPLLPELRLNLVTAQSPLWRASEESLVELGIEAPYWAYAWAGGQGIARYILDNPAMVERKRVLDFATGCGVSAIAAAKAGAVYVQASEIDPLAIEAARLNAALNGVTLELVHADLVGDPCENIDIVLAGDVFFESNLGERCAEWFHALTLRGKRVLVGDPGRYYLPAVGVTPRTHYVLPDNPGIEDEGVRKSSVFEIGVWPMRSRRASRFRLPLR